MRYPHLAAANKDLEFVEKFNKDVVWNAPSLPNGGLIFPAGDNPATVAGKDATHMRDDDCVIGVTVDGKSRAYPYWIADKYHAINDTLSGERLLVTC